MCTENQLSIIVNSVAEQIYAIGDYKTVANRSYYAVFSAMRAVLALQGFDSKKHAGIISAFRKDYIKTGILPQDLSAVIDALVEIRQGSDYDDFYLFKRRSYGAIAKCKIFH